MKQIVGIGAGGHAQVIIEILRLCDDSEIVGMTDPNSALWNTRVAGVTVIGSDDELPALFKRGVHHAFIGVGGVGDNTQRRLLYEKARALGFDFVTAIHPRAIVSPNAVVEAGVMIFAGAIINFGARLDKNVIVNTGAIVEHDCIVGAHAHISPGAVLCGGVRVGIGAHIGANATIRQGITIGDEAIVGAGAVVVDDVPARVVVVGAPAKILRAIPEAR